MSNADPEAQGDVDPGALTGAYTPEQLASAKPRGLPSIPEVEIESVIGRGGMGVVYLGVQPYIDRRVAVKVLDRQAGGEGSGFVDRFRREAKILAKMVHPNIVACYQAGVSPEGECYLVMEYVDGPDLTGWVREHGTLSQRHALELTLDLFYALEHAFTFGIIHRDVKPDNLLLARKEGLGDGSFVRIGKLADLGLAKPQAPGAGDVQVTATGMVVGTPATMAPEQLNSPELVDFRADLYGSGCVLYFALTGRPAFPGENFTEIIVAKVGGAVPDPRTWVPELDEGLGNFVMQLLAPNPEGRPQSYRDAITACGALLSRLDASASPAVRKPTNSKRLSTDVGSVQRDQPTMALDAPASVAMRAERARQAAAAGEPVKKKRRGAGVTIAAILFVGILGAVVVMQLQGGGDAKGTGEQNETEPSSGAAARHMPAVTPAESTPGAKPVAPDVPAKPADTEETRAVPVVYGEQIELFGKEFGRELDGWKIEPEGSFAASEDMAGAVQGSGSAVAQLTPSVPPPWQISGIVHPALNGAVSLRDAGVALMMNDGSALGLSCKELSGQTIVDLYRLADVPPADQEALGKGRFVDSKTEEIPFTLTLEHGQLTLTAAGHEIGVTRVTGTPTGVAIYSVGGPTDSVRISNLTLRTAGR